MGTGAGRGMGSRHGQGYGDRMGTGTEEDGERAW